MTLLALDLQVPDVGSHPTDSALRHALAANRRTDLAGRLRRGQRAGHSDDHPHALGRGALHLSTGPPSTEDVWDNRWQSWLYLIVFILCIPSGYIIGSNGPYVLLLLAVPNRQAWSTRLRRRLHRQIDQR
ncbi:MAG: hypothetical protein QOJ78_750 [Pseudonocardiales bacterium]|nr:hypothetical protein [Pseudonocardiales bacterium]